MYKDDLFCVNDCTVHFAAASNLDFMTIFSGLKKAGKSLKLDKPSQKSLKVPKREIFVTELIILSHSIWIGDLRTKAKNRFVRIVRLLFAILVFFR